MSTEENKTIVRRSWELYEAQDLDACMALFASNFVAHVAGYPDMNPEAYRQFGEMGLAAFPDQTFTIEAQIAEGDKVVTRLTSRGT